MLTQDFNASVEFVANNVDLKFMILKKINNDFHIWLDTWNS